MLFTLWEAGKTIPGMIQVERTLVRITAICSSTNTSFKLGNMKLVSQFKFVKVLAYIKRGYK